MQLPFPVNVLEVFSCPHQRAIVFSCCSVICQKLVRINSTISALLYIYAVSNFLLSQKTCHTVLYLTLWALVSIFLQAGCLQLVIRSKARDVSHVDTHCQTVHPKVVSISTMTESTPFLTLSPALSPIFAISMY